jgi:hypothetical protein
MKGGLAEKSEGKRPLERHRRIEDNINMDVREI